MKNFKAYELVSPTLYNMVPEELIERMFDTPFWKDVDQLISDLKEQHLIRSAIINDWHWGGGLTQSGFREKTSTVGADHSQHRMANAGDFKFRGGTIEAVVKYLKANHHKYPNIVRAEDPNVTKTWLHLDGKNEAHQGLYVFLP